MSTPPNEPRPGAANDPTRPIGEDAVAAGDPRTGTHVADRPVEDDRDRRGGAWIWALLALLILGLLAFFLLRGGDDGDTTELTEGDGAGQVDDGAAGDPAAEDGEPGTEDTAADDGTGEDTASDGAADGADGDAAAGDDAAGDAAGDDTDAGAVDDAGTDQAFSGENDPGTISTEDGEDLFAALRNDADDAERLSAYADQDVEGQAVRIQQVIDDRHFWVGTDEGRRIFVHLGADMAVEGVELAEGERIDFSGFLKPNPPEDSADVHDLPEDQGGEQHRQQGHHIELTDVRPTS